MHFQRHKEQRYSHQTQLRSPLPNFINAELESGNIKGKPTCRRMNHHYPQHQTLSEVKILNSVQFHQLLKSKVFRTNSPEPNDSDFLMWNNRPITQVHPDETSRLSSTPQKCQATIPGKWYQYHLLHRLDHKSLQSTLIRMKQQWHMELDGIYQRFYQNWTSRTCRPFHSVFWKQWR